jgi:myo-inositol-1(or 4)-monophosphatase
MTFDNKNLSRFLEAAVAAARQAGRLALDEIDSVKTYEKSPSELVTDADPKCQKIIIDTIAQNFPGHGFIAEEGKDGKLFKQSPTGEDFWWVIDPIDGTNNFSQRVMSFAVSIGLIHQGRPVLGVIFDPSTDSMFAAAGDLPPQYNGKNISVSGKGIQLFQTIGIESIYTDGVPSWITYLMKTLRCRSLGTTALHLAYVAKGSFVAAVMDKPKLWDIAAGAFLVESAGGIVTDWKGNSLWPVDMQKYSGQTFNTLAANKIVHKKFIEIIAGK